MRYDDFRPRNTIEVCCFIGVTDTTSRNLVFQAQIDRRHQCDLYAYVIPTERVVSGTRGLPPPPMARAWGLNSEWAMRFGVPAERCKDDKGRDRTVYLVEHFEDGGSDGHTDYHLAGWFVVGADQYNSMVTRDLELDAYFITSDRRPLGC